MYRLFFRGTDNQTLSVAGMSIPANKLVHTDKLPAPVEVLKKIKNLTVEVVEKEPSVVEYDNLMATVTGKVGVRWEGTVAKRHTEYGWFSKGVTRWDLSSQAVVELCKMPSFVKVGV